MKLTKEAVKVIGKVIGAKLHDLSRLDEALRLQQKEKEFKQVADFLLESKTQIGSLLHKWKDVMKRRCTRFPDYADVDLATVKAEKRDLLLKCEGKFKRITWFANEANAGKTFIQIDMQSANYTSFKQITGTTAEWSEFFKSIIPNFKRDETVYRIPDVIYNSKYVRMIMLSELPKLQAWWELQTTKVLKALCDADQLSDLNVCVNSDELIIDCGTIEAKEVQERIRTFEGLLPQQNTFRTKSFQIRFIPGYKNNYIYKELEDGSKRLMNIAPYHYLDLFKKHVLGIEEEPIGVQDEPTIPTKIEDETTEQEGSIGNNDPEWQSRLAVEKEKPFIPPNPDATFSDEPDSEIAKRRAFFAQSVVSSLE